MIVQRFTEEGLAHFSYVLVDEGAGEAAVIDPRRDTDEYVEWIDARDLNLVGVVETHLHADYASGAHELAETAGVPHYLSAYDEGEKYQAHYDHVALEEGDRVEVGSLRLEAVHTPGHTPEHLSYLLYENPGAADPVRFFTGDFLFVGSLGRPDLIGEDVKTPLASKLFESVRKVKGMNLPGELIIHPAHGSGSLCGAGLKDAPQSTLAEEREENRYFSITDRDDFVRTVLDALGDFPPYYKRMKETNSRGAHPVLPIEPPAKLDRSEWERVLDGSNEHVILDLRDRESFGAGHVPGSLNLGLSPKLNAWAPWVVPYETPIYLVGSRAMGDEEMEEAYRRLIRVELDDVVGYLKGGIEAWKAAGRDLWTVDQLDPDRLEQRRDSTLVVDVRMEEEYERGHVPGAVNLPVGRLEERVGELDEYRGKPLVTVCGSGYRSSLAASLLKVHGFETVGHLKDGFESWEAASKPVDTRHHEPAGV